MTLINLRDAMKLGMGQLKLPPEHFWKMTPPELNAALQGAGRVNAGLARKELDELMQRFPDAAGQKQEGASNGR